jgi:hypothetical protein
VQVGAENKKKVMWAGGLGGFALLLIVYEFFGSSSAPVTAAQPSLRTTTTTRPSTRRTRGGKERPVAEERLDPTLDLRLLAETEQTKYTGNGRNIFVAQAAEIPKPVAPATVDLPVSSGPPQPPPPPPPPPITLKFFGFANKPGEPKKVFLSQGDDVFIAVEGDIVDRRYKVIHIAPTSVEVEDVLYNNRQSIPLTQSPQG